MTYIPLATDFIATDTGASESPPNVGSVGVQTSFMAGAINPPAPASDVYGIAVPTPSLIPVAFPPLPQPAPVGPTAPNLAAGVVQAVDQACGCDLAQQLTAPAGQSTAGLTGANIPAPTVGVTNLWWLWLVLGVLVLWAISR